MTSPVPINPANQIVLDPAYTYRVSDLIAAGKLHPHPENPIKAISEPIGWRQRYHATPLGLDDYYLIHDSQNSANFALWPPIKEPEHFLAEYNAQQAAAQAAEEEAKAKVLSSEGWHVVPGSVEHSGGVPATHPEGGGSEFHFTAATPQSLEDAAKPWREAIGRRVLYRFGYSPRTISEAGVLDVTAAGFVHLGSPDTFRDGEWSDPRQTELLEVLRDDLEPSDQ